MSLDDPAITPSEKCRYDLGVAFPMQPRQDCMLAGIIRSRGRTVLGPPLPDGSECDHRGFTIRDFAPQETAAMHSVGDIGDVGRTWQYLYRCWLPSSDFEPAELPAMEVFVRLPEEIGWETFDLNACIPVARL
jgi:DNA gyrase inhibitor GyrI